MIQVFLGKILGWGVAFCVPNFSQWK